jgi:hypothetical protein
MGFYAVLLLDVQFIFVIPVKIGHEVKLFSAIQKFSNRHYLLTNRQKSANPPSLKPYQIHNHTEPSEIS